MCGASLLRPALLPTGLHAGLAESVRSGRHEAGGACTHSLRAPPRPSFCTLELGLSLFFRFSPRHQPLQACSFATAPESRRGY